MLQTPLLKLPYLAAQQAQKHITHNEALKQLDALVQISVLSRTLAAPPAAPAESDRYLIAANPTGVWSGQGGRMAHFTDGGWCFYVPQTGWQVWVQAESQLLVYDGAAWRNLATEPLQLGINTSASPNTRLAVASAQTLLTHEGSDHRLTLNKAQGSDTASLLLQAGYSGRAEIGLCGDNRLHMKVSADGTTWRDGLIMDATGRVDLPYSSFSSPPNLLINGDFLINQRGFSGGALAANAYGYDRWKADAAGATVTVAGGIVALSAGALMQVVEPALFGLGSFAGQTLTLSLEGPATAALSVQIGSKTASLAGTEGRRGVTLTLGAEETGPIAVRLGPVSALTRFARLRLDVGTTANAALPCDMARELMLCQRYYARMNGSRITGISAGGASAVLKLNYPVPMRAVPVVNFLSTTISFVIPGYSGNFTAAPVNTSRYSDHIDGAVIYSATGFSGPAAQFTMLAVSTGDLAEANAEL